MVTELSQQESPRLYRRAVSYVRNFPILYKMLIANGVVAAAAVAGSLVWLNQVFSSTALTVQWQITTGFGVLALGALILVNYALLRTALQPLSTLSNLVTALQRGDVHARAERPLFGDRETFRLIDAANGLLDELEAFQDRMDDLSQRITTQLETERKNIARELHDDTAQNLATLLALAQMVARATDEQERTQLVEDIRDLTRQTMEGVRRMSVGLRPDILDDLGITGALRWYAENVVHEVLPEVDLDLDASLGRLSPVAELALYRIAQEALGNIARHAQATKVAISLRREGDDVALRITDDGVGFEMDSSVLRRRDHLGLFTMKERARLAGGEVEVASEPGRGTTILARLPLTEHYALAGERP